MENEQTIIITNGTGSTRLTNGTYSITSSTLGYNDTSILPNEIEVTENVNEYDFTIAATGTLTIHVTENGTAGGTAIVGAKFFRCDSTGTTYGTEIITNDEGNAIFNNVPFADTNAPTIYYKQTESDSQHEFDNTLKTTTMTASTSVVEVTNTPSPLRTITLTDANYTGLPIESGTIIIN